MPRSLRQPLTVNVWGLLAVASTLSLILWTHSGKNFTERQISTTAASWRINCPQMIAQRTTAARYMAQPRRHLFTRMPQQELLNTRKHHQVRAGLEDFMLLEDDFDRNDPEAKLVYKTLPSFWGTRDITIDIEENMRIPVPDGLDGEDLKWMWVQCKIMTKPPKPAFNPDAVGWEKWRYERPKLLELAKFYIDNYRTERLNLLREYCENPSDARERYGKSEEYVEMMDMIQRIMDTPPKLSNKVKFAGFPSMLDEETVKGTFEDFGKVVSLEYIPAPDDDEAIGVSGVVEFENPEIGQKAIEQWNGVDMGMGVQLTLTAIEAED
mmetsp:Transcript_30338/g.42291  ORF Transcript_30338/g.42291 Transcript_30338/m.42291 type:complete len:324 (+) Transcript_30338:48-1019(+)